MLRLLKSLVKKEMLILKYNIHAVIDFTLMTVIRQTIRHKGIDPELQSHLLNPLVVDRGR